MHVLQNRQNQSKIPLKSWKSYLSIKSSFPWVTTPLVRELHFCILPPLGATKFARSLWSFYALRHAATLSRSSLEVGTFEPGTCQVGASNLSSSSLPFVKFERGTCQVRACNLSNSSLGLVKFEPETCQVRAWNRVFHGWLEYVKRCQVRA